MGNGHLIIGGGAIEASKNLIFSRFLELAGGVQSKISIITVSSSCPDESFETVAEILMKLGMAKENLLCVPLTFVPTLLEKGWTKNADEKLLPFFEGVKGIWFTGGDQLRITGSLLMKNGEDTIVLSRIREILDSGGVIGGTSAGAAIMSSHMIGRGSDEGALIYPVCSSLEEYTSEFDQQERMLLTHGLGFFPEGIVDQHFNKRPRLQRLMCAMSFWGEKIGYGISEDTALCYSLSDKKINIIGSGHVMRVENKGEGSFASSMLYT